MSPRRVVAKDEKGFDLTNFPLAQAVTCPRCGRMFEAPIRLPNGRELPGHVQGDPRTCVETTPLTGSQRDARARKAMRGVRP